jgi:hypothetical protein
VRWHFFNSRSRSIRKWCADGYRQCIVSWGKRTDGLGYARCALEQEINGVENMLYMSSSGTSDGRLQLTVTFKLGTNLDAAQVQVQNRVNAALPRLPEDVRRLGVTAKKQSPDLTMAVQFFSPDGFARHVLSCELCHFADPKSYRAVARCG